MPSLFPDANTACPPRRAIAIYDLDRTVTVRPTFTDFLLFAARTDARWRLALIPVWIAALIGYRIGLYGRETLKPFGIKLFVGHRIEKERAERLAKAFADKIEREKGYMPGALRQIEADRATGATLVIATAAPEFYACEIASRLGFDACIASLHQRTDDGGYSAQLSGRNNYGAEKWRRVKLWLADQGMKREDVTLAAYSDHASDAPLLESADRGFFISAKPECPVAGCEPQDWRS